MFGKIGFEVCNELKVNFEIKDILVMFLLGKLDLLDCVKGYNVGVVDYIVKLFNVEEFMVCICVLY